MKPKQRITPQNGKPAPKTKINKKRLFLIFSGTFVLFFLLCMLVASLITPSIDVPALNGKSSLNSMSSNDFKGRVDPRLRTIEMQEEMTPSYETTSTAKNNTQPLQKADALVSKENQNAATQESQQDSSYTEDNQIPYDSRANNQKASDTNQSQDSSDDYYNQDTQEVLQKPAAQPKPVVQQRPVAPQPPAPVQDNGLMLRDKVKTFNSEPPAMVKVMVGNYSNPDDARKIAQDLSNSSLNVLPFIKEKNGVYSLQVGSFSNQQKAERLASELRKRSLATRVIQE